MMSQNYETFVIKQMLFQYLTQFNIKMIKKTVQLTFLKKETARLIVFRLRPRAGRQSF